MKRHNWDHLLTHVSRCKDCGILRRQVFYPGGRGSSGYYREDGSALGAFV